MSSILSALARSEGERERSQSQPESARPVRYASPLVAPTRTRRSSGWWLGLLALVMLIVGIVGQRLWQQRAWKPQASSSLQHPAQTTQQSGRVTPDGGLATQPEPVLVSQHKAEPDIQLLTSINWDTRPMPAPKPKPVVKAPTVVKQPPVQEGTLIKPRMQEATDDLSDVSPELLAAFEKAVSATNNDAWLEQQEVEQVLNNDAIPLADLPDAVQAQVPTLLYSSHVFSSKAGNRAIRLNGIELKEGDWLNETLEVVEIQQEQTIMRINGQSFSLSALTDWPG